MNQSVQWAAKLEHVREVSLLGTADLAYWKERLTAEGLAPAEREGQAQILIIAAEGKFLGVTFRELSFSVLVSQGESGIEADASYLVHAFNSRRFFAFCERAFFSTPYYYGAVSLSAAMPARVQLILGGQVAFRAEMDSSLAAAERAPQACGEDGWEGPVYLPSGARGTGARRLFFARIGGVTGSYPFLPGKDSLLMRPAADSPILQMLLDSHLSLTQWLVRADARHAKSKTYPRTVCG